MKKCSEIQLKAARSSRYPFIAVHRGGPLSLDEHHNLMAWARICCEHVLTLSEVDLDQRLQRALLVAKEWECGLVKTGVAIKASRQSYRLAREESDVKLQLIARSIGQTIATAHMADHALGAAFYSLKAVNEIGKSVNEERKWQIEQLALLSPLLAKIVAASWHQKELDRRAGVTLDPT